MARFKGTGRVKMRGVKIANFVDGECEVTGEKAISRMRQLGFQEDPDDADPQAPFPEVRKQKRKLGGKDKAWQS